MFSTGTRRRLALAAEGVLDDGGKCRFVVADENGRHRTRYVAKVLATETTNAEWTNLKRVR